MKCRGRNRRREIVREYDITPIAHIKLLKSEVIKSDAGQIIKKDYYIFEAKNKSDLKQEFITCGMGAAKDFLNLIGHKGLLVFNPLKGDIPFEINNVNNKRNIKTKVQDKKWNETAKQLYITIMWLIKFYTTCPNTPLFELKTKIEEKYYKAPTESQIKSVNTIIKNRKKNMTLTEMINELRKENNIREEVCQFNLLIDYVEEINKKNKDNKIESFF